MFEVKMFQTRVTKNTVRYENDADNSQITVLYVQKSALPSPYPDFITVQVTPHN